jgi:hypothetical protein
VVITDAHITYWPRPRLSAKVICSDRAHALVVVVNGRDRTCRFEIKRWMPEHHYLPQYALMVKEELVLKDSYTPEPATHGPHPLYALVIAQLRKEPQILLESLEADDDTLELNEKKNKKQRLPESVLSDVLAKPLGCISRVLEVRLVQVLILHAQLELDWSLTPPITYSYQPIQCREPASGKRRRACSTHGS